MAFEERFELLCEKAQQDFDGYLWEVAHRDVPSVVKEAVKITVMGEILSQIKNGQFEHPFDVEVLLSHDRPLLAAYNHWDQTGLGIAAAVNESVNELLAKTRNELADMQARYVTLAPDEQARIMEYHNRELAVFDYLQGKELREKAMTEFVEYLDRDYKDCQTYIRNYADVEGEYPADFAEKVQAIYEHMKTYDGYTDGQLAALNRLPDPLTSVYRVFKSLAQEGPADETAINRAIAITTGTNQAWERDNFLEDTRERDDDGLDR